MNKKIAVLPGDGIGPEIVAESVKVLKAVESRFNHKFEYIYGEIGAAAIDDCGEPYPEETHKLCMESDAILFGAIGDPKYDNNPAAKVRPEQGLLKMRKSLGLYANIRPVEIYTKLIDRSPLKESVVKDVDLVVVRELTGGIYFGEPRGRSEDGRRAYDTSLYSDVEIERISRIAFIMARKRKGLVTLVDKANVLATSRLWREVVSNLHKSEYSDVQLDCLFVDNAAMQLVTDPGRFDVILTENMFGDILSDQASVLTGSIGLLPSSSIGTHTPLFEPIHGSFPQGAGKNIANPIATILSAAMLLEGAFDLNAEASAIRKGCEDAINNGILTPELVKEAKAYTTSDIGDYVAEYIAKN
ncbi:3-isopropylmalate dehydrogenase [Bacteroidales bacterium CF]|nr:3-isopropylmalate dehydrogenase [Bacteroidales bacterium CF]